MHAWMLGLHAPGGMLRGPVRGPHSGAMLGNTSGCCSGGHFGVMIY